MDVPKIETVTLTNLRGEVAARGLLTKSKARKASRDLCIELLSTDGPMPRDADLEAGAAAAAVAAPVAEAIRQGVKRSVRVTYTKADGTDVNASFTLASAEGWSIKALASGEITAFAFAESTGS